MYVEEQPTPNKKVSVNGFKITSSLYSTPWMWEEGKTKHLWRYCTLHTRNGNVIVKILFYVAEVYALRFNEANEQKGIV